MQLGFVIDHSRCIGCHACTVACKSENDVPVGSFRTWVKYTEMGQFPQVRRSFAVLRCNQCTNPPCVTICPVTALDKHENGIVDIDPAACIGCKSCMQACPYDALYINEDHGVAEKCHFCAHRTEVGLAPACAVVCPTEAIVPGDFNDPESRVSKLKAGGRLKARKQEAGTKPNVFYRQTGPAGLDPSMTNGAGGYLWSNQQPGIQQDAEVFESFERKAAARTTYDVSHPPKWGWKVSLYLWTKSIAGGLGLMTASLWFEASRGDGYVGGMWSFVLLSALAMLGATAALLVGDLKRPERFLYILRRPNWDSWLVRGGFILTGYGLVLTSLLLLYWLELSVPRIVTQGLFVAMILGGAATAAYTAWLFAQAKGRVLWMRKGLAFHLLVQAWIAGCAWMLMGGLFFDIGPNVEPWLRNGLGVGLLLHFVMMKFEPRLAPKGREKEYERAAKLITRGPFAMRHLVHGLAVGIVLPLVAVALGTTSPVFAIGGMLALWGLWNEEDIFVRAGQALPIS